MGGVSLTPVDGDPFAPLTLTPVDHDPFASDPLNGATMQAYNPSWRDKIGGWLYDQTSGSPVARNFVSGLVGSTGLGNTGLSVADFVPGVGSVLGAQDAANQGDYKGAALAAVPIPGAAELAPAAKDLERGIIAYHGSPHSFDQFSLDKIGTGEGAQAYGHGLYFAGNEDVAREYRDALSKNGIATVGGEPINLNDPIHGAAWLAHTAGGDRQQAALDLERDIKTFGLPAHDRPMAENVLQILRSKTPLPDAKEVPTPGSMYQVNIAANPDHFLDWDKPLSEQHPKVQEALLPHLNEGITREEGVTPETFAPQNWSGRTAYEVGAGYAGGPEAFTQKMRDAGIPGIKYLDAGSRSAGDGSRNYVVFDDATIKILKKYGIAGALGLGGAQAMMQPGEQPSQYKLTPISGDPFAM